MYDIRSRADIVSAMDIQAIAATTVITGETIAALPNGYEALDFCFMFEITSGDYEIKLYEGDESDMSDEALVDSDFVVGDLSIASVTGTQYIHVGYVGYKSYVRAKLHPTNTPVCDVAGIAYKQKQKHCPTV